MIGGFLIALSAFLRFISYPIVSADYTSSLVHWMDALRGSPGLTAFAHPFSDYSPLYLYLLKLISFLPGYDLYWIKGLSILFDILLAVIIVKVLKHIYAESFTHDKAFLAFSIVLLVPTFLMNSSLWGQCDSIYASFVLLSLYLILRNKPLGAAVAFGVAISFKLQAVFFLPVLVGYLLTKNRGWAQVIVIPIIYIITIIPAALSGGSFGDLLFTYVRQAGEFQELSLSSPSIYALVSSQASTVVQSILSDVGYVVALGLAVAIIYAVMSYIESLPDGVLRPSKILFLSLVSVLAIPFFLPHMHERYFYLADVFSMLFALYRPRYWFIPAIIVVASFFSYMPFLSGQVALFGQLMIPLGICAVALFVLVVGFIPRLVSLIRVRQA